MPVLKSSIFVTATIWPAPAESTASVLSAWTSNNWPSFTPLRTPSACTVSLLFSVPE